jgi:hypothetical protein
MSRGRAPKIQVIIAQLQWRSCKPVSHAPCIPVSLYPCIYHTETVPYEEFEESKEERSARSKRKAGGPTTAEPEEPSAKKKRNSTSSAASAASAASNATESSRNKSQRSKGSSRTATVQTVQKHKYPGVGFESSEELVQKARTGKNHGPVLLELLEGICGGELESLTGYLEGEGSKSLLGRQHILASLSHVLTQLAPELQKNISPTNGVDFNPEVTRADKVELEGLLVKKAQLAAHSEKLAVYLADVSALAKDHDLWLGVEVEETLRSQRRVRSTLYVHICGSHVSAALVCSIVHCELCLLTRSKLPLSPLLPVYVSVPLSSLLCSLLYALCRTRLRPVPLCWRPPSSTCRS